MILYQDLNSFVPYNCQIDIYEDFYYVQHFHRDYELIYVIDGSVEITVEDKTFTLNCGEYALILQDQIHGFETPVTSRVWVCVFSSDYVKEFHKLIGEKISNESKFLPDAVEHSLLLKILINGEPDRLTLCAGLTLVCSIFMRNVELVDGRESYDKNILHRMLKYISKHFTEDISLSKMSEELGYEEHYLSRCFHSKFGKNFKHFINEYRVNYAKHLLVSENKMTMTEIAYTSGFQSLRSFNRAFVDIEGVSPRTFR